MIPNFNTDLCSRLDRKGLGAGAVSLVVLSPEASTVLGTQRALSCEVNGMWERGMVARQRPQEGEGPRKAKAISSSFLLYSSSLSGEQERKGC